MYMHCSTPICEQLFIQIKTSNIHNLKLFMAKQTCLIYFLLFLFLTISSAHEIGGLYRHRHGNRKLFVFGDSYADTGNCPKSYAGSWKEPYGITFPGRPDGRFSDGRVLTDYIASFLGMPSPLPYKGLKSGKKLLQFGINFAYGGTGVFNTLAKEPNMTAQINFFQQLLEEKVYTKHDLNSSIALVSLGGNDYATFMATNGSLQGFPTFTETVINQLALNLKRIHGLGVKRIAVTAMEPLGCLPVATASNSYRNCSETENSLTNFHNQMLQQTVKKLNNGSGDQVFVIIDLHTAFLSALNLQQNHTGISKFENPLKPCCVGVDRGYSCGNVDQSGAKKYTVCDKPQLSFFWDMIHPSNQGWFAVYLALQSSLHLQLY
ncbi:GDSL esterase/lipase [Camellia lanceoleosa]|uniref:GDSL esterase/lipase n=1 Tax=Camellia lanceoleosa TaxID=1840588 RepID=A0ACC0J574_9ERIC|nr:GDSL esterase/lipase [Camellia lanceoleosa]